MGISTTPKVSVILTTYNQEDTLAASIDSVLAQQVDFPFEIELADDCSTDGTPRICRDYADRYPHIIRYTRNEVNRGCRDNYFDTLLRCRAPYIADIAGDDLWCDPTKLARQAAILDAEPEVTLVHTGWQYLHHDSGQLSPTPYTGLEPWLADRIDGRRLIEPLLAQQKLMAVHSCTVMYRKDTFLKAYRDDEALFRSPEYPCEDLQYIAAVAYAGIVAYLPEVTLSYRVDNSCQITSDSQLLRAFRFNMGVLGLRLRLQCKYGVVSERVAANLTAIAVYTAGLAFRASDSDGLKEVIAFCRENRIFLPLKTRLKAGLRHLPGVLRLSSELVR